MSETGIDTQDQEPKISRLAIVSMAFGILGLFILAFKVVVVLYPYQIKVLFRNIAGLLGIVGLVLGAVAFERIKKSKWVLKGSTFAILGIVFTASVLHLWLIGRAYSGSRALYIPSTENLRRLTVAIVTYGYDNGRFPDPNQWCDVLLEHGHVDIEHFACPSIVLVFRRPFGRGKLVSWPPPKKGRCHFAMNPNCGPDSPSNTVLLFEAREGWNQFGGPEILTTERHKGIGCLISYNDARVTFEQIKDPTELSWADE